MSLPTSIAQPPAAPLIVDYYLAGDTLIIASATTPGRLYVTTSTECTCPAGREAWPCPHAAVRLDLLSPRPTAQVVTFTLDADWQ
jgi:hypothetical protein